MTVNEITGTSETELDQLYNAVRTLVDTIYRYEGDGVTPPDSEDEARGIAAQVIRAAAEGEAVPDAIQKFWEKKAYEQASVMGM